MVCYGSHQHDKEHSGPCPAMAGMSAMVAPGQISLPIRTRNDLSQAAARVSLYESMLAL